MSLGQHLEHGQRRRRVGHTPLAGSCGFTQIELMVAVGILALLVLVFAPSLRARFEQGDLKDCQANLKNIAEAIQIYMNDNAGEMPVRLSHLVPSHLATLPSCPAARSDTYSAGYHTLTLPQDSSFSVCCSGANHLRAGMGRDEPWFVMIKGLGP